MKNPKTENVTIDNSTGEIIRPRFRSLYGRRAPRQILSFDPAEARTKQEFKDDCDINKTIQRFLKTGRLDEIQKAKGMYADITDGPQSYHEALNLVVKVNETFSTLPANIRAEFGNDPQKFMESAYYNGQSIFDKMKAGDALAVEPDANTPPAPENAPVAQPVPVAAPPA